MFLFIHFYIIFGTNLLTRGPAEIAVFCLFQCFTENEYQTESKRNETFGSVIFLNKRDPEDLEWTSSNQRGGHEAGGAPTPWARPPPSWAPRGSTDLLLPPIYTYIPPSHQTRSQNPISTASTFSTREIPSWSFLRRSAGGGINHGGPLHQHQCLSDEL